MKKLFVLLFSVLLLASCGATTQNNDESTFTVGLECNYAPFNWLDTEETDSSVYVSSADAYCDGYDVMIANQIADDLGSTLVVNQISWDGLIPALQSNTIDAVIAGMSETPARAEQVLFTNPYYQSDYVMIVKKDSQYVDATTLDDFSGADIVGQLSTAYDVIIDQIEGVNHLTPLNSYPLIVHAILSDAADGAPAEKPTALAIVEENDELTFIEFNEGQGFTQTEDATTAVSIAVNLENTELAEAINESLANISEETREEWMAIAIDARGE